MGTGEWALDKMVWRATRKWWYQLWQGLRVPGTREREGSQCTDYQQLWPRKQTWVGYVMIGYMELFQQNKVWTVMFFNGECWVYKTLSSCFPSSRFFPLIVFDCVLHPLSSSFFLSIWSWFYFWHFLIFHCHFIFQNIFLKFYYLL